MYKYTGMVAWQVPDGLLDNRKARLKTVIRSIAGHAVSIERVVFYHFSVNVERFSRPTSVYVVQDQKLLETIVSASR